MKIKRIAIIGLGYVGLPLAVKLSNNFDVLGFDLNNKRVSEINKGIDSTKEVPNKELQKSLQSSLKISNAQTELKTCNVFIVTVPTPVTSKNKPDFKPLLVACRMIAKVMEKKSIIVFESTVYPGATEEICGKEIERVSKLRLDTDFYLGYSPERVNPGDKLHTIDKITKVISSNNKQVEKVLFNIYSKLTCGKIFIAKDIKVAEASKVIENSQRDINIAFMNEIAKICQRLNISIFDVLDASKTKWNFLPFNPGLVGGHCIGVDPFYLATKARQVGVEPKVILSGRNTNDTMSDFIADLIDKNLQKKSKILIFGLTFKENVPDLRNSKIFNMIDYFKLKGHLISVCDPFVKQSPSNKIQIKKLEEIKSERFDSIILAVSHRPFRGLKIGTINSMLSKKGFIFDITGFWRDKKNKLKNYFSL